MKNYKKLLISTLLAVIVFCIPAYFALAISNPDSITFGSGAYPEKRVFENVLETGDMLITAEIYPYYAVEPTDYTADEAFIFELISVDETTTIISRPIVEYGDRPIGIYLSASQVTSLGIVSGTAYGLRLTGNPAVFASPTGNTVIVHLSDTDYIDQTASGNTTTTNLLRNKMIEYATNMENNDTPTSSYLSTYQGITYLSVTGADLFNAGIPGLDYMCPVLYVYSSSPVGGDQPTSTGAYAATLTPTAKWGTTVANGLTSIGEYLGINQALAGSVVAIFLCFLLAIYIYKRTGSGLATLMLIATCPFFVAWMGLMPLALAFVAMMLIVILGGWFFFRQGAL